MEDGSVVLCSLPHFNHIHGTVRYSSDMIDRTILHCVDRFKGKKDLLGTHHHTPGVSDDLTLCERTNGPYCNCILMHDGSCIHHGSETDSTAGAPRLPQYTRSSLSLTSRFPPFWWTVSDVKHHHSWVNAQYTVCVCVCVRVSE